MKIIKFNKKIIVVFFFVLVLNVKPMCQNKYALLVGISDYPSYVNENSNWGKIHGANDVQLIKPILQKQGFEIRILTDAQATYKSIVKEIERLNNTVVLGDVVYLHFSGHGQAVEDLDGDEADGWDEAFIPYDAKRCYVENSYQGENHLLDDELNSHLNAIRKKAGINPAHVDSEDHINSNMAKGWITEEQAVQAREIKEKVGAETAASLPEAKIEGIAKGRLNKFFQESTLMNQEYIMESKVSVKDFIARTDKELKCTGFKRLELGA